MNPLIFYNFGFIPNDFFNSDSLLNYQIISSMFLHGSFFHILGNMLYLWIFGDNVEDSMGRARFVIFYFTCGIIAALTQALIDPTSDIPMVGASGAIAGVLGAYLMLFPRANVKCLVFIIIIIQMIRVPAFLVLGIWIVSQFFSISVSDPDSGGVAYFAHIGGFLSGMFLVSFFKKKEVRLFKQKSTASWEFFNSNEREFNFKKNDDVVIDFMEKSEKEMERRKH
tara:strand:+ start:310 stop:984 length:675 start_codon:yes stop_codon:yes gene_type:complete